MNIETKYNYGDTVWFMDENKPVSNLVTSFAVDCSYKGGSDNKWGSKTYPIIICYSFTTSNSKLETRNERECFPTKESLLESL